MEKKRNKSRVSGVLLWCLLFLVCLFIVVMVVTKRGPEQGGAIAEKPVAVKVMEISPRDLPDIISLPGRIEAVVAAELAAEKAGRIVEICVEEGDAVAVGDLLMRIDDSLWRTGLKRAEVEDREAAKDLARWEALKKTGAVSDSELDGARTRAELAEAALAEYRTHVEKCRIVSPMRGVVNDRFFEQGEYVNEGAAAFRVVDIDTVKLMVNIPEQDVLAVRRGDEIEFSVASLQDRVFTGIVEFVSLIGDANANSFLCEIHAANGDQALRPGMIAEAALRRATHGGAITAPLAAVIPRQGEHVVFVADGGHAVLRVVRMRGIVGRDAVLTAGLKSGDLLIVEGHRALEDGAAIKIAP